MTENCRAKHQWYHGANSAIKLEQALLTSTRYDAVEIDLSQLAKGVMLAHHSSDPDIDYSLESFLSLMHTIPRPYKVKFDFKDRGSVDNGIELISNSLLARDTKHSLVFNVDCFRGPGGGGIFISCIDFQEMVYSRLPTAEISVGMTTNWKWSTLFFSHGYSHDHMRLLLSTPNVTVALRFTIIAQTPVRVVERLSRSPVHSVLIWGEGGLWENAWASSWSNLCIDSDVWGPGWWVLGTYAWVLCWAAILCYVLYSCIRKNDRSYSELSSTFVTIPQDTSPGQIPSRVGAKCRPSTSSWRI